MLCDLNKKIITVTLNKNNGDYMADRVGFEPTSPWGLPDFESCKDFGSCRKIIEITITFSSPVNPVFTGFFTPQVLETRANIEVTSFSYFITILIKFQPLMLEKSIELIDFVLIFNPFGSTKRVGYMWYASLSHIDRWTFEVQTRKWGSALVLLWQNLSDTELI